MCAIKGAKPARQLSLRLPAQRTIALAAKQNSPEKSRLGKQRGKSKQMPNRISQASFVVMLNSKGLPQIREEWAPQREKVTRTFHKEKCCYKGRYQLPIQRKYGDCELHKNRCVYTTDTQLQPFLLHLFSKIKKAKMCGSVSFWWSEFEVQNRHGIIDSLTKTLPMKFQRQTFGSALLPLLSVQPLPLTPASPGLGTTVNTDIVTFYFKMCHVPRHRRTNISGTF